jgi:hypothetical protein
MTRLDFYETLNRILSSFFTYIFDVVSMERKKVPLERKDFLKFNLEAPCCPEETGLEYLQLYKFSVEGEICYLFGNKIQRYQNEKFCLSTQINC